MTSPTMRAHFRYGRLGCMPDIVHAEKDPAVHRLETVAHVGQRPADDHAHGVVEVGRAHLVGYLDLLYSALQCLHASVLSSRRPTATPPDRGFTAAARRYLRLRTDVRSMSPSAAPLCRPSES